MAAPTSPSGRPTDLPPKTAKEERKHRKLIALLTRQYAENMKREQERMARRDAQMGEAIEKWRSIAREWPPSPAQAKKLKSMLIFGIPPCVRGELWRLAIGNSLAITRDLYLILAKRGRLALEAGTLDSVALSRESTLSLIAFDLPWTFPSLQLFQKDGPMHADLRAVLEAYTCLRPDIGYVQGMSFLAAMLLLSQEPFEAFVSLANVLARPIFVSFFRLNMTQLRPWLNAFASLVDIHVPVVGRRVREHGIEPEMYFLNWVMTMFTQVLSLDLAAHAWDCFVLGGDSFIFRIAFAILRLLEPELADSDYEMAMTVLTAPLPAMHDDATLFTTIYAFELTDEAFRAACREAGCDG